MKTRIIHTRIWEDDWFVELPLEAQYLWLYLLTNSRINLCGMYRLSDRTILNETKIKKSHLEELKSTLEPKAIFIEGWVYIPKSQSLGGYKGELIESGIKKEMQDVPSPVKSEFLHRVSMGYRRGSKVQEIRNNKLEIRNKKQEIINNTSKDYMDSTTVGDILEDKDFFKGGD